MKRAWWGAGVAAGVVLLLAPLWLVSSHLRDAQERLERQALAIERLEELRREITTLERRIENTSSTERTIIIEDRRAASEPTPGPSGSPGPSGPPGPPGPTPPTPPAPTIPPTIDPSPLTPVCEPLGIACGVGIVLPFAGGLAWTSYALSRRKNPPGSSP